MTPYLCTGFSPSMDTTYPAVVTPSRLNVFQTTTKPSSTSLTRGMAPIMHLSYISYIYMCVRVYIPRDSAISTGGEGATILLYPQGNHSAAWREMCTVGSSPGGGAPYPCSTLSYRLSRDWCGLYPVTPHPLLSPPAFPHNNSTAI